MYLYSKEKPQEVLQNVFDKAIVHTRGVTPEDLLRVRRPSEPEEIIEYRLSVYEPITQDEFSSAITDAKKAVIGNKARLVLSEKMQLVFNSIKINGLDFVGWVKDVVIPLMFEDPNASIIFWPMNPGVNEELILDIALINSWLFVERRPDLLKWKVGKTTDGKNIYYAVNKTAYWKLTGDGDSAKSELIYEHGLGYLPTVYELGGITSQTSEGYTYLNSYFNGAFAWGNKVIRYDSDLEGAKTLVAYPIREIEEAPCINPSCVKGYEFKNNAKSICSSCNGKGVHIPSGTYAYIIKKKANIITGDGKESTRAALTYITPPVEGLRFLNEDFEAIFAKMQRALNQLYVSEAQSGIAKEIDREGKYTGIDSIAVNVWKNIILKSATIVRDLVFFTRQNSTGIKEEVSLILPETFKDKTEQELTNEIESAINSGDRFGLVKAGKELQKKKYGTDLAHLKAVEVFEKYDPLAGYTLNEKMDLMSAGFAERFGFVDDDFVKSGKGLSELMKLKNEPGFLEMSIDEIILELNKRLSVE